MSERETTPDQAKHQRRQRPLWLSLLRWLPAAALMLALLLVFATPWGVQWAWQIAEPRLPAGVSVGSVEGRLIGPLTVTDVAVETETATVALQRARLDWRPSRLLLARVQIADLDVQGLDIALLPSAAPPPDADAPKPLSLDFGAPISLIVEHARLQAFSLKPAPDAPAERIDDLRLVARWTPRALVIDTLDITAPRVGSLQAQLDASLAARGLVLNNLQLRSTDGPLQFTATGRVEQYGGDRLAPVQEQLRGAIDAQWTALRWPLTGEPLAELPQGSLQAEGQLDELTAALDTQLSAQGQVATITAQGQRQQDNIEGRVQWSGLAWPLTGPAQVKSQAGDFTVRGTLQDYDLRGTTQVAVPEQVDAGVELRAGGSTKQLNIADLTIRARDTVAKLDGKVAWAEGIAAQFHITAPAVNPAKLAPALADWPGKLALDARGQFRQTDTGQFINLDQFQLDGTLRDQAMRLTAKAAITPQHIIVPEFDARMLGATATGDADITLQPKLGGRANVALRGLDPAVLDARFPGLLQADAKLAFSQASGQTLRIDTDALRINGTLRERDIDVTADATVRGSAIELRKFVADIGRSKLRASGTVDEALNLTANINSPDLSAFWPGLTGTVEGDAKLSGPRARPRVVANLQADSVRYQSYKLDTLKLDADVDLDTGNTLNLTLTADDLRGASVDVQSLQLTTLGTTRSHTLDLKLAATDLNARLAASGGFNRSRRTWSGTLDSGQLVPVDLAPWSLLRPTNITLGPSQVGVDESCWGTRVRTSRAKGAADVDAGQVCITASQLDGETLAQAQIDTLDMRYIAPLMPLGTRLEMTVNGVAAFRRTADMDSLAVNLDTSAGRFIGRAPTETSEADTAGDTIEVAFEPGKIRAKETGAALEIGAMLPLSEDFGRGLDLQLALRGDGQLMQRAAEGTLDIELRELDFLALLLPELTDVTGSIDGRLELSGALGEPRFGGGLQLRDGAASIDLAGIDLRELTLDLQAKADGGLDVSARATSDGGPIMLEGSTRLFGNTALDATVKGERFLAYNTEDAKVYMSPDLTLKLSGLDANLDGTLTVPEALITPQKRTDSSAVRVADDQVLVGPAADAEQAPGLQLRSKLKLVLGDKVRVEALGLKTNITGQLTVRDTPGQQTTATGELNTVGGSYKAYGQNLDISRGRLIFAGGPVTEPGLDVKAARYPTENIEVGVRVRGPLSQPVFELYSSPPMPQQEQLSYLVLGRSLATQDSGATGAEQAALANAALSLGLGQTGFLGDFLRDDIGLDEVQIGAGAGQSNDQAALVLGKYLTPRLFVSYGVGLFTPGQTFRVRYQLSSKWTVKTETGTQTGGDFVYSIER